MNPKANQAKNPEMVEMFVSQLKTFAEEEETFKYAKNPKIDEMATA